MTVLPPRRVSDVVQSYKTASSKSPESPLALAGILAVVRRGIEFISARQTGVVVSLPVGVSALVADRAVVFAPGGLAVLVAVERTERSGKTDRGEPGQQTT